MKTSFCFHPSCGEVISMKFGAWHDSCAEFELPWKNHLWKWASGFEVTTDTLMVELWVSQQTPIWLSYGVCVVGIWLKIMLPWELTVMSLSLDKLVHGKETYFRTQFSNCFVIYIISISDVFLRSLMLTWVQVMACCHQASSHHLNQCWPSSTSPYGVTRQQWATSPCGVAYTSSHVVWFGDVVYYVFLWSSTLIQAMAWCCLGPSHCVNQCWRRHTGHQTLLCGWALFQYDLVDQHCFR